MSRGGRPRGGGARRGRRTAGPESPWDSEPGNEADTKPMPLFPETKQSVPRPLSQIEREQIAAYRSFREKMHDGPIYTVLDPQSLRDEEGGIPVKQFDPFEGVERYSMKYKKSKRTLPDIHARTYVKELFPKELWSTIDPKSTAKDRKTAMPTKGPRPRARLNNLAGEELGESSTASLKRKATADNEEDDEGDDILPSGRRRKNPADDEENPIYDEDNPNEEAEDEADRDSEFEESDDGEGDDYNAEQYFDAGEDDEADYDGGGGEDDGGYF